MPIYKYEIPFYATMRATHRVEMPEGARLLHADLQYIPHEQGPVPEVHVWADVNTSRPVVTREFHVVNTGGNAPAGPFEHLSTIVDNRRGFVWHVYAEREMNLPTPRPIKG